MELLWSVEVGIWSFRPRPYVLVTSVPTSAPAFDPYEPRPSFVQRNQELVTAFVVLVFTVGLAVVAFPPYTTPECAYAMLVPGAYWAYRRPRLKLFLWTMGLAQAIAWTVILGWLHHVTWLGLLLLGPFVGAWIGTWYAAAWWILPRMVGRPTLTRLIAMLGLAAVWVLIEWTRTWLLSGFPWLPLAASQWTMVSMLQIASFTGAYGVSFMVVMVNLGFAAYAHRLFREGAKGLNKRSQEFFFALFLVLACFSLHVVVTFNRGLFAEQFGRVAFMQPYIPQEVKWDPARAPAILEALRETSLAAAATKPDLMLWPEAVTPFPVRDNPEVRSFIEDVVRRGQTPVLLGSIAVENQGTPDERWRNAAFIVTPMEGVRSDSYAKRQLVPFGEFVPFRPVLGWLEKVVPVGGDFEPGEDSSPLIARFRGEPTIIGPLICYEDIYPQLARRSVQAGSAALTVLTNNGWFGEGGAAYQHAAHSVLRAVENRRPVLRAGNGGWSGWIDEFGGIRSTVTNAQGSIYFRGSDVVSVTRDSRWIGRESFYTRFGDWFVALCVLLVAFGVTALLTAPPPKPPEPEDEA